MRITRIPRRRDLRKRRVAAYCRVSTRYDSQEESLATQTRYYRALIGGNFDWEFAGIYSDEKSGTKSKNRPGFRRLVSDALAEKIDYIIVKSISRFSRNIVDCQLYLKALVSSGADVWFEHENIVASDPSCSTVLAFLSVIAQDESRSISENIKWSYRQRYRRGEYNLGSNRVLGYDWSNGALVPNADSKYVRLIFQLYVDGISIDGIRRAVAAEGYLTRGGRPVSWSNILYILQNEAYRGDRRLQKRPPKDWLYSRPSERDDYESFYLSNDHEAIVDDALWNAAQARLRVEREKSAVVGRRGGRSHFLYGKIFCDECGAPMTRRTLTGSGGVKYKAWMCRERRRGGRGNGCQMRTIRETELLQYLCRELGYDESAEFPKERFWNEVESVRVG